MKIDLRRKPATVAAGFAVLLWIAAFAGYIAPEVATGHAGQRQVIYLGATVIIGFILSMLFYVGVVPAARELSGRMRLYLAVALFLAIVLLHAYVDLLMIEHYLRARPVLTAKAILSGTELLFLNNVLLLTPAHITYVFGVGMGLSMRAVYEREQRLAAALAAAQDAQLAALRFQINPHFLFNSLNAVMSLVGSGRNRDAETVVARLAEFFRATLSSEPNAIVTLEEELDVLGAYLDIEAARFGERLHVVIDLPDHLARASMPHFLLQPLAENAVKHGVAPSKRKVTLTVSARAADDLLVVQVRDDGAGGAPPTRKPGGVGLSNVSARLKAHYGDRANLRSERLARGFLAEVAVPLSFTRPAA
ncbi:MAG: histidine kinase [Alphaproteobacteria bacterium]|nr:histidine kinase [Alphaproteobacteria bacterium]MBU1513731.1 histidine kinase [Alphaproteobacteria bacterium]MBU2094624.1 histidine kinase [Alphaproteobacteria bacterium]MBU2150307.1 histidine kinase [Alphaproteobacteria bacterium]MBU2309164.1 histidine kinase [Alphaproteobacteria bacterium]